MSIKNKLLTAFSVSILVTVLACISIFIQLKQIDKEYSHTLNTSLPQTYATAELSRLTMAQATLVQNYILGKDTTDAIQGRRTEVLSLIDTLDETINQENDTIATLITDIKEKSQLMHDGFDEATKLKDTKGIEEAATFYIDSAGMNVISFMDDATALTTEISLEFDAAQADAKKEVTQALIITIIAIIVAVATGVFASILLTKIIAKPMHKLEKYVNEITEGNLNAESLEVNSKDEIGSLAHAMNEMRTTLVTLLRNLSDNATHLSATSEELMASAEQVTASSEIMLEGAKQGSEAAQTMALAANESSIAMSETAHAVQRIAETSQELHLFASKTEELATVGTNDIHTASSQMSSIYESTKLTTELIQKLSQQSKEIESITQVITGISDQTNLLALNAAIEAARAGEHGKGFAVVADEVRKLAEESNRSASEIVTLTTEIQGDTKNVEKAIEASLKDVEQGVEIIGRAGNSFREIVGAIGDMKTQIAEVSAVTEQISATSQQVAASVSEIAHAANETKENANSSFNSSEQQLSTLQEIAAVAQDLSHRAQGLQSVVTKYNV